MHSINTLCALRWAYYTVNVLSGWVHMLGPILYWPFNNVQLKWEISALWLVPSFARAAGHIIIRCESGYKPMRFFKGLPQNGLIYDEHSWAFPCNVMIKRSWKSELYMPMVRNWSYGVCVHPGLVVRKKLFIIRLIYCIQVIETYLDMVHPRSAR